MKKLKMDKGEYVYTNNEDKLRVIQPFDFRRGFLGERMGTAKNDKGELFMVVVDECGSRGCNCGARAIKMRPIYCEHDGLCAKRGRPCDELLEKESIQKELIQKES